MKWQTIDEFVTFCRENPTQCFYDLPIDDWDIAHLWRDGLQDNTDTSLTVKDGSSFLTVYNHAIKLFGADNFNQSLQQFFDDNKDTL